MKAAAAMIAALVLTIPASAAEPETVFDIASPSSLGRATIEVTSSRIFADTRPGMVQVSRSQLFDRLGRLIGTRTLICVVVVSVRSECRGTFQFPKGNVVVGGHRSSRTNYILAVTGGTGLYDNARGSLSIKQIGSDPKRDRVFIQLVG